MTTESTISPAAWFVQGYVAGKWGLCLGPRTAQAVVDDLTGPHRRGIPPASLRLRGRGLHDRDVHIHTLGPDEIAELLAAINRLAREPGALLTFQQLSR